MQTTTASEMATGGSFLVRDRAADIFTPEDFTHEDQLFATTASDFVRGEVMPNIAVIEGGDHDLMASLMRKAGDLGLLAADIPECYGGLGLTQMTSALISERLNQQQSFALTHEAHTVIATLPLLFFGSDSQKQRYLPRLASGEWIGSFALSESNSGSDALAMQTRADRQGDGSYILNGEKMWITNSAFATLFTVFARTDDGIGVFLVERSFPGVSFGKEEHKLGMHGTSTRRVILSGVVVPEENAFAIGKGHYAAFCALNLGRFKLEAGAVGGLKYLLRVCTSYTAERKTFGKPLNTYGMIQQKIGHMAARTFGLESMIYRLAGDLERLFGAIEPESADASSQYHRAAEEFAVECSVVKVIGSEAYSDVADEAIQIHGGYGYTEEFAVARAWRDQRLLRIGEGANEIVRLAIVNTLLRRVKAGRLDIAGTGLHGGSGSGEAGPAVNQILQFASIVKKQAMSYLIAANDAYGELLPAEQELCGAIADLVCAAYAVESVALRITKLQGSTKFDAAVDLGLLACRTYGDIAGGAQTTASECLYDVPPVQLPAHSFGTLRDLGRAAALRVIASGGYPLA